MNFVIGDVPFHQFSAEQQIAYLQERRRNGVPFNARLIAELDTQLQEKANHYSFLFTTLMQQMDTLEVSINKLFENVANLECPPEMLAQIESLKNMSQHLLNNQTEIHKALAVAQSRLAVDEIDLRQGRERLNAMQKKVEQSKKYENLIRLGGQKICYYEVHGHAPPSGYKSL